MTVAELIAELQKFDPDLLVKEWFHEESWGDWLEDLGGPRLITEDDSYHKDSDYLPVKAPFVLISG